MKQRTKFLVFVAAACVIHAGACQGHRHVMRHARLMQVDALLRAETPLPETLILGTSHAAALDPEAMPNAINLAGYGEHVHQTWYKLRLLLEADRVPKRLVMGCDLGMLRFVEPADLPYQWYWNRLEAGDPSLCAYSQHPRAFVLNRLAAAAVPYADGETDAIDHFFAGNQTGELRDVHWPQPVERVHTDSCLTAQISAYGAHYFDAILAACAQHRIAVYLVRFPVTEAYYSNQSACFAPEAYYQRVDEIVRNSAADVHWIDLHDAFPRSDFRDPHHLNPGVARAALTRMVAAGME